MMLPVSLPSGEGKRVRGEIEMKFRGIATALAIIVSCSAIGQAQTTPPDAPPSDVAASPDVNLTPRRLVFGPNDRGVKEITVFNRTNATATYTIVLLDQVMTPDGALVSTEQAPAAQKARLKSATDWIRYSPRQVTLGPQEAQTIRLQARRPADAPAGEYRTHFSVTAVPPADTGLDIEDAAAAEASQQLRIRLTPVYGIMIPVIVRTGELPADASISDVKLIQEGSRKGISLALNRSGERSLYGGLEVFLLGSGQPKKIAQIRGVGVYPELDSRRIALPVEASAAIASGSKVRIVYTDDELNPGKVLAQTEVTLP